jgi:hypothetical protein
MTKGILILNLIFFISTIGNVSTGAAKSKNLLTLNEENWRDILEGEWMIELYVNFYKIFPIFNI